MHSAALPRLDPDETRFVEMVFPEQANHYGTLFGGHALSLMGGIRRRHAARPPERRHGHLGQNRVPRTDPCRRTR